MFCQGSTPAVNPLRTRNLILNANDIVQKFMIMYPFGPDKRNELVRTMDDFLQAIQHKDAAHSQLIDCFQMTMDRWLRQNDPDKTNNLHMLANEMLYWWMDALREIDRNNLYLLDKQLHYSLSSITGTNDLVLSEVML